MHLTQLRLKTIRTSVKMALDATPTKIIAFHVLNAVPFYNIITKIIQPFSRKELKDKVENLFIYDMFMSMFFNFVLKHEPFFFSQTSASFAL